MNLKLLLKKWGLNLIKDVNMSIEELYKILLSDKPSDILLNNENDLFKLITFLILERSPSIGETSIYLQI